MLMSAIISAIASICIYYIFFHDDTSKFQKGYDWAMESHMKGIPIERIQQDIDNGMTFDPSEFDAGAQSYISSLRPSSIFRVN